MILNSWLQSSGFTSKENDSDFRGSGCLVVSVSIRVSTLVPQSLSPNLLINLFSQNDIEDPGSKRAYVTTSTPPPLTRTGSISKGAPPHGCLLALPFTITALQTGEALAPAVETGSLCKRVWCPLLLHDSTPHVTLLRHFLIPCPGRKHR